MSMRSRPLFAAFVLCCLVPVAATATNTGWEGLRAMRPMQFELKIFGEEVTGVFRPYGGLGFTAGYGADAGGARVRGGMQALFAAGAAALFVGAGLDVGLAGVAPGWTAAYAIPFIEFTMPIMVCQVGFGAWSGLGDKRGTWAAWMFAGGFSFPLGKYLALTTLFRADVLYAADTPVPLSFTAGVSWYVGK